MFRFNLKKNNPNWLWSFSQAGIAILPLFPLLGTIIILIVMVTIFWSNFSQIKQDKTYWGLAILSILLITISSFAAYPIPSFLGLANFLPFFLFFAAFSVLISKLSQLEELAWILILPSLVVTTLGFAQLYANWQTPKFLGNILGWQLVPGGNPTGRMASVFMYTNILAAYLLITFILGIGLWLNYYRSYQQKNTSKKRLILLFLSLIIIINAVSLILTSSRNAWAIAFIACLSFALYLNWYWLVLSMSTAVATVFWASFGIQPSRDWLRRLIPAYFWARLSDQMYPDRPLATLRLSQWQFSWDLTLQRPYTGWGLRNFTPLYQSQMGIWLGHPHNLFFMLTAETGIPATLLFFGIIAGILVKAIILMTKIADNLLLFTYLISFLACILFNCFDVTIFDLRLNLLGWLLLAAIYGVVANHQ